MQHDGASWRLWIEQLRGHISDPFEPVERPGPSADNVRTARQRRQRQLILCCARQLVAEDGVDNVHLQMIAERSGVSIQTLYNLVGNRQEILGSAASDWVFALARSGVVLARRNRLNVIFTTLEIFWASAIVHRTYNANIVRSRAHQAFMRNPIVKAAKLALKWQLDELRARGELVNWADPAMVAEVLVRTCHTHISEWLASPYDEQRFRSMLVNSCGLLLHGAMQGEAADRLASRFAEAPGAHIPASG